MSETENPLIYSVQRIVFSERILSNIGGDKAHVEITHNPDWGGWVFRATANSRGELLNLLRYLEIEIQLMEMNVERMGERDERGT